jgi:hypothetical protein
MNTNLPESDRRLQEIGNQLGTPILAPTTAIQTNDDRPELYSDTDLAGTTDLQPSSKNPMLQYLVAGTIGLGVIGVPLTVLFGLGSTPQIASQPTTPEPEESTSVADRELEDIKTQSALDIQTKTDTPIAQAPKPTVTTPAPKPNPVTKTPTPSKPAIAAQPKPLIVTAKPNPVARSLPIAQPIVSATPVATIAQPIKKIASTPKISPIPAPIQVAVEPVAPVQPVVPVAPEPPPLSFEQASALGAFGSEDNPNPDGELAVNAPTTESNLSPSLALPVGVNVLAHTVTPYTAISSSNNSNNTETPLSVQLDQPIQLAQGFSLPVGTIVQFGATVSDSGAVSATSRRVFIDGTELQVPAGAFALTASNSSALVANRRSLRTDELAGADTTAAIWGAAGTVGKAFADSGNSTVVNSTGFGSSVVQTNSGNVNIPGALLNGAFSPLAKAKESRANALAQELQQSSKLNEIPVRSAVRVFIAAAVAIQIPIAPTQTTAVIPTIAPSETVAQPPIMIPTAVISQPTAISNTGNTPRTFIPQTPTATTIDQPINGLNGQSPIAPTKPNQLANTQPPINPIDRPTVTSPQPPLATQAPSSGIETQSTIQRSPITETLEERPPFIPIQSTKRASIPSPIAPTKPNNLVNTQPVLVPIQIDRQGNIQPTTAPSQSEEEANTPNPTIPLQIDLLN